MSRGRKPGPAPPVICALLAVLLAASVVSALPEHHGETASEESARNEVGSQREPSSDFPLRSTPSNTRFTTIKLTHPDTPFAHPTEASNQRFGGEGDDERTDFVRRLVAVPVDAVPRLAAIRTRSDGGETLLEAELVSTVAHIAPAGLLRDQRLAMLTLDMATLTDALDGEDIENIDVEIAFDGATGPISVPTGPLSVPCARAIQNYEVLAEDALGWSPRAPGERAERSGTVSYCHSSSECAANAIDVLFIADQSLASAPVLNAYAVHHADYYGLNVGIFSTSDLAELTSEAVHQLIQDVYDTQSAEHFGDGHLGFVLLIGDAFADDNETVMIPAYYGYGGTESASDHYYACVSGDDDLEDVMLGRLSVGNLDELQNTLSKSAFYMPHVPGETWHDRVLLLAGLFYTIKDDYVALFDQYDELIPDDLSVDRIYRHDYGTDQACALDVVDAINDGYLIVNFNGDGWIAGWHRTMNVTHLPLLRNQNRLPVVLSMACNTGRFDNVTDQDATGSYDSITEQMMNCPDAGAIAVLAAARASDGGIFRTFTKEIYRAAFEQHCVFTGELFATAKLLHVQSSGDATYARQFNLFGDPAIVFSWDFEPDVQPELAVKPYNTTFSPEFAGLGDDVSISVGVTNQSAVAAQHVLVRVSGASDVGSYEYETVLDEIGPWATDVAGFVIPQPVLGGHALDISVDPENEIEEPDEDNNALSHTFYVYPSIPGFPVELEVETHSPCVAHAGTLGTLVLIPDDDARLWALDATGTTDWISNSSWGSSSYGPEIAAAAGDLDGDGVIEMIATKFMGAVVLDPDGDELWTANTDDPVGYPVLADADSDGDLDIILATRAMFGGQSSIVAIDENGDNIWDHELDIDVDVTTTPVVGDFDLDGHIDVAYGTSEGAVEAFSCATTPPTLLWGPVSVGESDVHVLGLADLDSDGLLEIAVGGDGVRSLNAETGSDRGFVVPLDGSEITSLALGDVDGDGQPDIVAATDAATIGLIVSEAEAWTRQLSGSPSSSATIADIDGYGAREILVTTDAGYVHVFSADGGDFVSPIPLDGPCLTPFAYDLTGDGNLDIMVSTSNGTVYGFTFGGQSDLVDAPDWLGLAGSATRASILEQPYWGTVNGSLLLCGNFRMTDDLVVPEGSSLTIASGTRLVFENAGLEIDGALNASGYPDNEIVMTSSIFSRDRWGGIEALHGASITMYSCVVEDAAEGLHSNNAAVYLVDCEFVGNGTGAIIEGGTLYASGTEFSNSDDIGLSLEDGTGSLLGCIADGNGTAGLFASGASSYFLTASSFTGTLDGHGAVFLGSSNATVDSCSFSGNSENGAMIKTSSPSFEACLFEDNGLYGVECERLSFPSINWSTVTGNEIGVRASTGSFPKLGDNVVPGSGYNSILGNHRAAIANHNSQPTPVYAKRNWWGSAPPVGRIFMGYVIYGQWLSSAPAMGETSVADADLPVTFSLGQNTPNPFNPTTTLSYAVPPSGGYVSIAIYSASGRLIRVLHEGPTTPGTHLIAWDGRDRSGNMVASGIYFARMVAPDFEAARKMLLIR